MKTLKIWNKPSIDVAQVKLAKAGHFTVTDDSMTHKS